MTRHQYRHQGLTLSANRPLPRLIETAEQSAEVNVEVCDPGQPAHLELPWEMPDPPYTLWRADTEDGSMLRLRYANEDEWAEYVISPDGGKVWISRSANVPLAEASEGLLGPVFSCLLAQRGVTCLHAAVVQVDGRVLALAGQSGAGKSTTTTAFLRGGAAFVSDDVAALTEFGGRLCVQAGPPRLRIRPETATALEQSFDALEPMWVHESRRPTKRYLPVPEERRVLSADPLALDGVYFLGTRSQETAEPQLRSLSGPEALARLMLHRHMAGALGRTDHRRDFEVMARLAETVPVAEVLRPEGVDSVHATTALIRADVTSLA